MPIGSIRSDQFSLTRQLTIGAIIACLVAFLISAIAVHLTVRAILTDDFDQLQIARSNAVASLIDFEGNEVEFEGRMPDEFLRGEDPSYFQLWRGETQVIARSPSLKGVRLARQDVSDQHSIVTSVTLPDGRSGRQVQRSFHPSGWRTHQDDDDDDDGEEHERDDDDGDAYGEGEGDDDEPFENADSFAGASDDRFSQEALTLVVASGTDHLDRTLARLRFALLLISAGTVVGFTSFLVYFVPRGLMPLRHLSHHIENIDVGHLPQQVDLDRTPEELAPVVDRFNELLNRLREAFDREKAFTSNVAQRNAPWNDGQRCREQPGRERNFAVRRSRV